MSRRKEMDNNNNNNNNDGFFVDFVGFVKIKDPNVKTIEEAVEYFWKNYENDGFFKKAVFEIDGAEEAY